MCCQPTISLHLVQESSSFLIPPEQNVFPSASSHLIPFTFHTKIHCQLLVFPDMLNDLIPTSKWLQHSISLKLHTNLKTFPATVNCYSINSTSFNTLWSQTVILLWYTLSLQQPSEMYPIQSYTSESIISNFFIELSLHHY